MLAGRHTQSSLAAPFPVPLPWRGPSARGRGPRGHITPYPRAEAAPGGTHRAARSSMLARARPRGGTVQAQECPRAALLVNSLVLNSGLMLQSSTHDTSKLTTGSASRSLRARPFLWPHTQDAGCPAATQGGQGGWTCWTWTQDGALVSWRPSLGRAVLAVSRA